MARGSRQIADILGVFPEEPIWNVGGVFLDPERPQGPEVEDGVGASVAEVEDRRRRRPVDAVKGPKTGYLDGLMVGGERDTRRLSDHPLVVLFAFFPGALGFPLADLQELIPSEI